MVMQSASMWKKCNTVQCPTKPANCCAPTHDCSTIHWSPIACLTGIIRIGKCFQTLTTTLWKESNNTIFRPQILKNTKRCLPERTYLGDCDIPGYCSKSVRDVGPTVVWFASHISTPGYLTIPPETASLPRAHRSRTLQPSGPTAARNIRLDTTPPFSATLIDRGADENKP